MDLESERSDTLDPLEVTNRLAGTSLSNPMHNWRLTSSADPPEEAPLSSPRQRDSRMQYPRAESRMPNRFLMHPPARK